MLSSIAPVFKLGIAYSCYLSVMCSLRYLKRLVKEYVYNFERRTLQFSQFKVTLFSKKNKMTWSKRILSVNSS